MFFIKKNRGFIVVIMSVLMIALSVLPVCAANDKANEKVSSGLMEKLAATPEDTIIKISVFFVDPPAYEKDVADRTAALLAEYNEGTLDASLITEDFEPEVQIPRMARAEVVAEVNEAYLNKLEGLIDHVEFVSQYVPYACLALKASDVATIAALDFIQSVYEYEDTVCCDEAVNPGEPFFTEDPRRFGDTAAEGYPPDLGFDGSNWIHSEGWISGDVDRDGRVTASDARLAMRASVGLWTPFIFEQFYAADINGDNKITPQDARSILRAGVGLESL